MRHGSRSHGFGPFRSLLLAPPSSGQPQATAIASSTVDLPVPFSPARNVTPSANSSPSMAATAGNDHGHAFVSMPARSTDDASKPGHRAQPAAPGQR